jgi:hypothetical protein
MSETCRHYGNISRQKVDAILRILKDNGATVSGQNPWEVNTHQAGVRLQGRLNEAGSSLEVRVVDSDWYVSYSMVWQKIDELIRPVQAIHDREIAAISEP